MANEFDYFPLYYRKLVVDTADMSNAEFGAYMRLLLRAWDEKPVGSVPVDDATLARWTGTDIVTWLALSPAVSSRFQPAKNGRMIQKRMAQVYQDVRTKRKEKSDTNRANAKCRDYKKQHANALRPHSDGIISKTQTETKTTTRPDPPPNPLPEIPASIVDPVVVAHLAGIGVTDSVAEKLAEKVDEYRVRQVIEEGLNRIRRGKMKRDDLPGYVRKAIEDSYNVPDQELKRRTAQERIDEEAKAAQERIAASESERKRVEAEQQAAKNAVASLTPEERDEFKRAVIDALPGGHFNRTRWPNEDPIKNLGLRLAIYERIKPLKATVPA